MEIPIATRFAPLLMDPAVTLLTSALCQPASATGRSQLDQAGGADLWRQSWQACNQLAYVGHGDEGQGPERRKKLERVNNFFNRMRFIDDIKLWRKKDYWATPLEFLGAAGETVKISVSPNTLRCSSLGSLMIKCGWCTSRLLITTSFTWWWHIMRHPLPGSGDFG